MVTGTVTVLLAVISAATHLYLYALEAGRWSAGARRATARQAASEGRSGRAAERVADAAAAGDLVPFPALRHPLF
jgi:hypothetical protein